MQSARFITWRIHQEVDILGQFLALLNSCSILPPVGTSVTAMPSPTLSSNLQTLDFIMFLSLRTSHSEFPKQEKTDLFNLERISESAGDRPEVTYAQLNTNALSETASSPAEMSPESCDYATLKE
ncbi:V-set and transmembrane domain-containing protein 1 isoform X4 [Camelus bactrianus]